MTALKLGRPPVPPEKAKTTVIRFRTTEQGKKRLFQFVKSKDLNVSECLNDMVDLMIENEEVFTLSRALKKAKTVRPG